MIQREAEEVAPSETGGLLLGYEIEEEGWRQMVVQQLTGPGPDAEHSEFGFEPDGPWQREELDRTYRASDGTTTYLGDWHLHPGSGARSPSHRDLKTARLIARHKPARLPQPLTLIAGLDDDEVRTRCYRYLGRKLRRVELELYSGLD